MPFHRLVMVWPEARVHRTVQPLMAEVPARTVTSPWKPGGLPVGHEPTSRNVAVQAPVAGGVVTAGVVAAGVVAAGVVAAGVVRTGVVAAGVVGVASDGGNRSTRSSLAAGVPRPSRLLVATQSQPSGPRATVRSRPNWPCRNGVVPETPPWPFSVTCHSRVPRSAAA